MAGLPRGRRLARKAALLAVSVAASVVPAAPTLADEEPAVPLIGDNYKVASARTASSLAAAGLHIVPGYLGAPGEVDLSVRGGMWPIPMRVPASSEPRWPCRLACPMVWLFWPIWGHAPVWA
ncbi:MAG: hypothetical protein VKO21_08440 [Candidatus Sericytochromatia bacterium]|nr:hypothetical protein [Candidatus Sericytochromatia bacterium]